MAKEDIIRESLETSKEVSYRRKSSIDEKVLSVKISPRPILNKLGGGFYNKTIMNTIASVTDLNDQMFLTGNSGLEKV